MNQLNNQNQPKTANANFIHSKNIIIIFIAIIVLIAAGMVFLKSKQTRTSLPVQIIQKPTEQIFKPTQAIPKTNPFEIKTNPFKEVKTNPFD